MTEHTDEQFMELLNITAPIIDAIERMTPEQTRAAFGAEAQNVQALALRFRMWQATPPK